MRVLLGTTNPSKVKRFSDLLKGYDIEFITLRDIEVIEEPKERIMRCSGVVAMRLIFQSSRM